MLAVRFNQLLMETGMYVHENLCAELVQGGYCSALLIPSGHVNLESFAA